MVNSCLQLSGFLVSCLGWLGIIIATATNDWVNMCKYGLNTCKKMDELGAKGPWAECVISTGLYHCVSLTQILELPAYIQTTRALMITGSILGLPAVGMLLMSMPCINLGNEPQSSKNRRTILGGVLIFIVGSSEASPLIFGTVTLSVVRYGFHRLVSHRCSPGARPHVVRLLPLHRLGGHYFLPAGRLHPHLLLIGFLLLLLLSGEQPLLLLQTGGRQPATRPLHQSRQERPRLSRGEILDPSWKCRGTVTIVCI